MYFHYVWIISPGKGQGPLFEQTWIPFTQGCIVLILVEIGCEVLEKKIFKFRLDVFSLFRKCIFTICNYLLLEKGRALHLNKVESPSPKDALCLVGLKLVEWFWRRWKVYVNNDNNDSDVDRQRVNFYQTSSIELLTQVS